MKSVEVYAVILARGGSKGIVGKNLRLVGGVSLVGRSILACRGAGLKNIVVSSDSLEILAESALYGVTNHIRSKINSSDTSSSEEALLEVINYLESLGINLSFIVFIQPTSPFLYSSDITRCIDKAMPGLSSFTAYELGQFVWESLHDTWRPLGHTKELRLRRQETNKRVVENGACYVIDRNDFISNRSRFATKVNPIIVPQKRSLEIDTLEELQYAQELSSRMKCDWEK